MLPNSILTIVIAFAATALAADQGPEVSGPLTLEHRPHTNFETCRSSQSKTNCGFCYLGATFLGWNCACDTFVSMVASKCMWQESNRDDSALVPATVVIISRRQPQAPGHSSPAYREIASSTEGRKRVCNTA